MTRQPSGAARGCAGTRLAAPAVMIAGAFWTLAWLAPRPGEPVFMAAVTTAAAGYLWAVARLTANAALSRRALLVCFVLALAWRVPLLTLPDAPAHDAVRYLWDARVVSAGSNPYGPFRAIRGSSLRALDIRDETWGWTIEMQVKAAERGLRIVEVPVASGPRAAGRSKISGSLVGSARAAARMLEIIARLRLSRALQIMYCRSEPPVG